MERVISDVYYKLEKPVWTLDLDNPNNQEFNRKIVAVNNMYGWLYEKGVLEKTSFEFKDYSDMTYFAIDVKDLEPYRNIMEKSGVLDSDVAIRHIFDKEYTPCLYSGAIQLGWTMRTYRDFDGTVSRSWESGLVQSLSSPCVLDVRQIRKNEGVKAAVKKVYELSGFEPSDLCKGESLDSIISNASLKTVENDRTYTNKVPER